MLTGSHVEPEQLEQDVISASWLSEAGVVDEVGVSTKGRREHIFPIIKNSRSTGLAGPAKDTRGSQDTQKPGTQRSLLLEKTISSARVLCRDSQASAVSNVGESSSPSQRDRPRCSQETQHPI